ncbi:N-acetylgalactosamine-6-sulfatase [Chitinophaga lutea]|uniref:N-acetylgalactosamine-6-sulfatase n=1 Tax=Chitinophaga lutea TaxID=2488634 RepID=A0A3N4PJV6_9BACT|nr:arylsulfatase [Chitinophaga lutea]RPE08496.1 N-acetylgalactosamine-6-sulfatase [Chitinophaga lutea]
MKKAILFSCGLLLAASAAFAQKRAPNIIFIYADDLGVGELGAYGQQKIKTPYLDRLAKEGVRFTNFYTSTPVCAPARCMLLTGRHGGHSYIRGNYELGGFADSLEGGQMPLPEGTLTVAKMLQEAGYHTAAVGKWGLGMHNTTGSPNAQGFDYFYGYLCQKQSHNFYPSHLWENGRWDSLRNPPMDVHKRLDPGKATDADFAAYNGQEYAIDVMTGKALRFMQQQGKTPFFLYLPYTLPHVSLQAPGAAVQAYVGQFDEKPYYGQDGYAPARYPLSTYAAMITYLDAQVGIIMEQVKKLGLDDNTVIMFSSDNGATFNGGVNAKFFNSVSGLRGLKMDLYEGGIREPLIARWPGKIPAGTTTSLLSVQYDMMATIAAIAGIKAPPNDGISLLPAMTGNTRQQAQRPYVYFEYPEKGGQVAIRMGNWKAIKTGLKANRNSPWELYDLAADPAEEKNIAAQHPALLQQFDAIVKKEHRPAHIREWEFLEPKVAAKP